MSQDIKIYNTPELLAESFSKTLIKDIQVHDDYFLAVSGGSTPIILFKQLSSVSVDISWNHVHIFWCDERCVPPNSSESNYGEAKKYLLDYISIHEENVHRIRGENNLLNEVNRYADEINKYLPKDKNGFPRFNRILLGMGEDGHTASLFPGKDLELVKQNYCGVATHPVSGQKRISLTENMINNSEQITFLITGKGKAETLSHILSESPLANNYPAARIKPKEGIIEWLIDKEASSLL